MAKIFKVLVVYESAGDVYIEAESAQEARDKVNALTNEGLETTLIDQFHSDAHVDDVYELGADEVGRMEIASNRNLEVNMEALKDVTVESDCNYASENSNLCITHNKQH